jgi:hypothetical protein
MATEQDDINNHYPSNISKRYHFPVHGLAAPGVPELLLPLLPWGRTVFISGKREFYSN